MSAVHHPDEDLLWDYFRGALAPGLRLSVSTHLDLCPQCRDDLRVFTAIGGALLETTEGVAMSDNSLDLALARIERPVDLPEVSDAPAPARRPAFLEGFELPPSLQSAEIRGRYFVAPGVWMAPIALPGEPRAAKTYLMCVKAGMEMPEHTHRGREITVMLQGQYRDHKGLYQRGDFSQCDEADDRHMPIMMGDVDCLCLVAQEAAIIPKTWLGWLLKPIARI
ncbi:ChrR family anti-sigma-E factor [Asticcacaulis taihuensis]|jgi:putative transcriptional regulator|uniref:ChrR family anti-sigma-E factor n=1 Tax=Asticcacaulis taihuensis TaxID=260084 RepID=UPI003F7B58E5